MQPARARDRPPFMKQYLDRTPVRHPSKDDQSLRGDTCDWTVRLIADGACAYGAYGQDAEPDQKRKPAYAKQLAQVAREAFGAPREIGRDGVFQLKRFCAMRLALRQADDNAKGPIAQLAGPVENE